jgi:hypothetical protein
MTARLSATTTMEAGFKFGFLVSLPKTLFTYPPIHFKQVTRIFGYLKSQNLEIQTGLASFDYWLQLQKAASVCGSQWTKHPFFVANSI